MNTMNKNHHNEIYHAYNGVYYRLVEKVKPRDATIRLLLQMPMRTERSRVPDQQHPPQRQWDVSVQTLEIPAQPDEMNTMKLFNGEAHELIMLWIGIFVFGLSLSAIIFLIMEVTG
jgi:hypothetical protein